MKVLDAISNWVSRLPKYQDDAVWRVPYGIDSPEDRCLAAEIDRRRAAGLSLAGLSWGKSDDPYHPANNPKHPYYIG